MLNLKIIGKKGSKDRLAITKGSDILRYGGRHKGVDAVINYGLAGANMRMAYNKLPSLGHIPIVNKYIGASKYTVVKRAEESNILVPESRHSLPKNSELNEWIEKKYHSIGGLGIREARQCKNISGKYYQRFIYDRLYELRVHAFLWINKEGWRVQKRLGDKDVIAWNYKNGGHFHTIHSPYKYSVFREAIRISEEILKMESMAFGAVDLIVTDSGKIYFIEVNAAPGFTELSEPIYIGAFNDLKMMSKKGILQYTI